MKPLYWVAIGLGVIAFIERVTENSEVSPDPVGWILVGVGLYQLVRAKPELPLQLTLVYLAAAALLISAVLVSPDAQDWLDDSEPALIWFASLPALAFQAVLAHGIAQLANEAQARAAIFWRAAEICLIVGLMSSMLYRAAEIDGMDAVSSVGWLGILVMFALCLIYGAREWAGGGPPPQVKPRRR